MHKYKIFFLFITCLLFTACNNDDDPKDLISDVILTVDSHTDEMMYLGEDRDVYVSKKKTLTIGPILRASLALNMRRDINIFLR